MVAEGRPRVLVVDDQPELRVLIEAAVGADYELTSCGDGASAVSLLADEDFDAAIIDLHLPRVDGLSVLRSLGHPDGPVAVVLTAHADVPTTLACLRAGASDLIEKPFRAADLRQRLAQAIASRRRPAVSDLDAAVRAIFTAADAVLAQTIVDATASAMHADDATLMLPDHEGRLYVAYASGLSAQIQADLRISMGTGYAGTAASDREPLLLTGDLGTTRQAKIGSSIVFPMAHDQRLVGVLSFNRGEDKRKFRRQDMPRASLLCSQVTLALENSRLQRQVRASERLALMGQLVAGITHEINNPLTYVTSSIQQIAGTLVQLEARAENGSAFAAEYAELRECTGDAIDGIERITTIIRDMSSVGRTGDSCVRFDLNEAIRTAFRLARPRFTSFVVGELQLDDGCYVRGSPGAFCQVLLNLIINGAQAVEQRGQPGRVDVQTEVRDGHVWVRVADTGAGIAPEHLGRLFEPFFTTKSAHNGTGLGLSLSREIVRKAGGRLSVESKLGEGTVFTFSLAHQPEEAPVVSRAVPERRNARLLFVDDEPAILRGYKRTFGRTYDIAVAEGGAPALSLLADDSDFDAIISDLLMPGMNGIMFFENVSAKYPHLASHFLFVTGSPNHGDIGTFVATKRERCFDKPYDEGVLRDAIERYRRAR